MLRAKHLVAAVCGVVTAILPAVAAHAATAPTRVAIEWHQVASPRSGFGADRVEPNAAAVTCSGTGCDRTDPVKTGCADGSQYTVVSGDVKLNNVTFATINLRYSPRCGTNWAQISNRTGEIASIRTCRDEGDLKCTDMFSSGFNNAWSDQIYAFNVTATAYAEVFLDGGEAQGWATA